MIELKGVEILQTIESNPITFTEFRIFIIVFIIFITLFGLVLGWIKECPLKGLVGGFIVSLVVAFPVTLIQFIKPEKTYYKVKLSEDLSTFSDELSNYHVSQINKLFAIIMNL